MKVNAGQLLVLTTGIYDDYCIEGHVRTLKEFDPEIELQRFKIKQDSPRIKYESFLTWAKEQGLIEEIQEPIAEWKLWEGPLECLLPYET